MSLFSCRMANENENSSSLSMYADSLIGHASPANTSYDHNLCWGNSSASSFGPFAFSPSVNSCGWNSPATSTFITAKEYYHNAYNDDAASNTSTSWATFDTHSSPAYSYSHQWEGASVGNTPSTNIRSFKDYVSRYINAYGSPAVTVSEMCISRVGQMHHNDASLSPINDDSGEFHDSRPCDFSDASRLTESPVEHPSRKMLLGAPDSVEFPLEFDKGEPDHHVNFTLEATNATLQTDEQGHYDNQMHKRKDMTEMDGLQAPQDPSTANVYADFINDHDEKEVPNIHKMEPGGTRAEGSVNFFDLFKYADKWDKLIMFVGTLAALTNGASLPIFSLLLGKLVERLGTHQSIQSLREVCVWMGILAILTSISSYIEVSAWAFAAERQASRIKAYFLREVLRQNVEFLNARPETGQALWLRISTDVDCIKDTIGHRTASFLHYFTTFLVGYIVGFANSSQITSIVFFSSLLMVAIGVLQRGILTKLVSKEEETYAEASTFAHQAIKHIRTVFSYVAEEQTYVRYRELLKKSIPIATKVGFARGAGIAIFYFMSCLMWALILWYASILIADNKVNGGNAVACFLATLIGGRCLGLALQYSSSFSEGSSAAFRVFRVLGKTPSIDVCNLSGMVIKNLKGKIEFKDVSFAYPAKPEVVVLYKFKLVVDSGTTVALVGPQGGGKSTTFCLLQRLYDPDAGAIHLDDVNIQHLQLRWLRQQVAMVGKEPVLFATTVRDNILYGRPDATFDEIKAAAKLAKAHDFITSLQHGYDTKVGELKMGLSMDQKQRIAIAREVLKGPKILMLEDVTNGWDSESEGEVQDVLNRIMNGRTTIMIAERLSTIRQSTLIAVVHGGSIVEQGTQETLLSNPAGVYTCLVSNNININETSANFASPLRAHHYAPISATPQSVTSPVLSHGSPFFSAETTPAFLHSTKNSILPLSPKLHSFSFDTLKENIPLLRIIQMSKPDLVLLILGILGAVHAGVALPAYAYVIGIAIGHFYDKNTEKIRKDARETSSVIAFIGLSCFVAMVFQHGFCNWAGIKLTRVLRERTFAAILRKDLRWFDREENTSVSLANRVSIDSLKVRGILGDRYSLLSMGVASVGVALIICLSLNWRMGMLATALTPLLVSSNYMETLLINIGWRVSDVDKNAIKSNTIAFEAITNMRTVAALGAEESIVNLFVKESTHSVKRSVKRMQFAAMAFGLTEALAFGSYAILFYYGSVLVVHHGTHFAKVVTILVVLILSCFSVGSFSRLMPDYGQASMAARNVFCIMDHDSKRKKQAGHKLDNVNGEVRFQGVTFAYPAQPAREILKNFDLKVKAGTKIALVGGSGSGKSTILSLVQRFYDPVRGRILFDGVDIKDLHLKWLRNQMALVNQEPVLFACSIWENIAYGKQNATMVEIEQAARLVDAHEFISSLPDGYSTEVGEKGVRMSSGQMQKIAVARAILRDPKVLLLDEPRSVLDVQSQKKMQEALEKLMVNRTSIMVIRNLSRMRHVKRIVVIEAGRVLELGSHEKLMSNKEGSYYHMVKACRHLHLS